MPREHLYKAKRLDNGEWVEGNLINDGVTGQAFIKNIGDSVNELDSTDRTGVLRFFAHEVNPETVCQFTGITDRNGVRVFEGDIIVAGYYKWKCEVVWDNANARFICYTIEGERRVVYVDMVDKDNKSVVVVIGNIFSNSKANGGVPND